MDKNPQAARQFYQQVRRFSEQTAIWSSNVIRHQVTPDEAFDLSLISERVYGRRAEFLAVMAAAGLDSFDQELTQREILLPTEQVLDLIKRQTGFESMAERRTDKQPSWSVYG